jgi:hypothetical protein
MPILRRESTGLPPPKPSRIPLNRQESLGRAAFARELESPPLLSRRSSGRPSATPGPPAATVTVTVPATAPQEGVLNVVAADPPVPASGLLKKTFPNFALECGEVLPEVTIAYQTWGTLNEAKDNSILICHSLTSAPDADTWWSSLLGAGLAIDPLKYFVVCCNVLGSPVGSSALIDENVGSDVAISTGQHQASRRTQGRGSLMDRTSRRRPFEMMFSTCFHAIFRG